MRAAYRRAAWRRSASFVAEKPVRRTATREAFEILLDLLRHIDEGHDDVIFFADEAGSWQVGIDWEAVLPAHFACLAGASAPDEYARTVLAVVEEFADYCGDRYLKAARAAASPDQKKELRAARRGTSERR